MASKKGEMTTLILSAVVSYRKPQIAEYIRVGKRIFLEFFRFIQTGLAFSGQPGE